MTRPNIITAFDNAFKKSILKSGNWSIDGRQINWSYVEADIWSDLAGEYGRPSIAEVVEGEFDFAADEYQSMSLKQIQAHFAA